MFDDVLARLQAGETVPGDAVALLDGDRFGSRTIGLVWDTLALDRVTAHLDVDERHLQPFGLVHGGVWCSIVESLASLGGGINAAATGRYVVGVHNSTDFMRSVRDGRIDAVALPLHVGRLQQLWQVEISRHADGKTVARGQVRLQNLEPAATA